MAEVSAGNPCPFLRALVAHDYLDDGVVPLPEVTRTITRVAAAGEGDSDLPDRAVRLIALIANGISPAQLVRNSRQGLHLNALRDGPLDKHGAGSRILDVKVHVNESELDRLDTFASDKQRPEGGTERGLDHAEITRYMEANYERARGHRRRIDRKLMNGEFPELLRVIGRDGPQGRYLPLDDVRRLFIEQKLPQRILDGLKQL
ncbi:hypothetical protein ACWDE9_30535 [Streptomyces olivaceoviridis]|uniref:hypothetical protein n=1 Tax=Streptomyces olivaceoviridis TaxID=1921 RepID=UPI0016726159|nr:hypothetical protein [Streptomyces olivaceoviridis]GGZ30931.1 hypothetical protein GCM10010300_86800 [Streptomyces olivaceoviridis]